MLIQREVSTPRELKLCQRLRADVYLQEGYITPDQLQEGLDCDQYDEVSRHAGVFTQSDEVVGTIRMVMRDRHPLHIEKLTPVVIEPQAYCVEASRLVVHPDYRTGIASIALFRWFVLTAELLGVDVIYAVIEPPLFLGLRAIGFPFERIGPTFKAYNCQNLPTRCLVRDMIPGVLSRDERRATKLGPFFTGPLPGGIITDSMCHYLLTR